MIELDEIEKYIATVGWKHATTMPEHPHEYTMKEWDWAKEKVFDSFVEFIRKHGYVGYFHRKKFVYYDIGGYKYWTMGAPVWATLLINRAKT